MWNSNLCIFLKKKFLPILPFITSDKDYVHRAVNRNIQGVSKRALQLWKRIEIYTEDIHNVLNCQNVAKHTEFYLG